jgi:hypothetical protein
VPGEAMAREGGRGVAQVQKGCAQTLASGSGESFPSPLSTAGWLSTAGLSTAGFSDRIGLRVGGNRSRTRARIAKAAHALAGRVLGLLHDPDPDPDPDPFPGAAMSTIPRRMAEAALDRTLL